MAAGVHHWTGRRMPHGLITLSLFMHTSEHTHSLCCCVTLKSMLKMDHLSIWRQCVCMSQNFSTKCIEEEPKNDPSSRLALFVSRVPASATAFSAGAAPLTSRGYMTRPSPTARSQERESPAGVTSGRPTTARGHATTALPEICSGRPGSPHSAHSRSKRPSTVASKGRATDSSRRDCRSRGSTASGGDHFPREFVGGHVLWTFLSTPAQGSMFGCLHFLATVRWTHSSSACSAASRSYTLCTSQAMLREL